MATVLSMSGSAAHPVSDFFVRFGEEWVRGDPELATQEQYFAGAEQDALDRRLTPVSHEYRLERAALAERGLRELRAIDLTGASPAERTAAAMMEWRLDDIVREREFLDFEYPLNQFIGVQRYVIDALHSMHPIRNRRDVENYLARLAQVPEILDQAIARAERIDRGGVRPPRFILEATLGQVERFIAMAPAENLLATSLDERIAELGAISAEDRAAFVTAATKEIETTVYPAYRRVQALLQAQRERASDVAGINQFPGGDRAYAYHLRHFTTTELTPAEVHELGRREVARIEAEMDAIFRRLGFSEGSVKERYAALNRSIQPPAEPDPRPAILARYGEILADAEQRSAALFSLRPKAPCVLRREPPFSEANSAAHYTTPAPDGSRPGIFWAPLPGPIFDLLDMRSLTYHEAIPGHHFQLALQQELEDLPRFQRHNIFGFNSAYGEGWALYAEWLADHEGWYGDDLHGRLGYLDSELFRARRLVVDTGLHVMGWTRQQAIDFGIPASEVERY
ncbi:MAG TPA: DUF885 domain-containing protein, partial [Candidatus Synoicihabitans sp.]|nr:DUF885 domain-containing protein [Candidatus Synoicihabitans sp.]